MTRNYRFAVVAKDLENVFFTDVGRGCVDRAAHLTLASGGDTNVTCLFVGSPTGDKRYRQGNQTAIVEDLLLSSDGSGLDGMAIAVIDQDEGRRLIEMALDAGVPTITYNVDAPDSGRLAYVGTDSASYGAELANALLQEKPSGGKYAIVDRDSTVIKEVAQGARARLAEEGSWREATDAGSPLDCGGKGDVAQDLVYEAIERVPDLGAVISAGSYPVREQFVDGWKAMVRDGRFAKVTFVVSTERQEAVDLLKEGYIDSLVGQQPFMQGAESVDRLYELRRAQQGLSAASFANGTLFKAPIVSFMKVDAYLQSPAVENNYLGSLVLMGYVFFAAIAMLSVLFAGVITRYKNGRIIRASQPLFLYLIIAGVIVLGSAIIPLGFDGEKFTRDQCSAACDAVPWLLSMGIAIIISALYAKTHRINVVMKAATRCRRIKITEKDVLMPFAAIMTVIAVILLCKTILAPANYAMIPSRGTDHWNRTYKSFYGTCHSDGLYVPYLIALYIVIGISILGLAVEAYRARNVQTEYQESHYIGIVIFSLLQAVVVTTAIVALLDQNVRARYAIIVISIFIVCMASLLLIFMPKFLLLGKSTSTSRPTVSDEGEGLHLRKFRLEQENQSLATASMANE